MEREDFFSYYKIARQNKVKIPEFEVYEKLLFETLDFFDKYDMMKGTVMGIVFEQLYIRDVEKEKDDIAYDNGIAVKSLYNYRLQYDEFAAKIMERRGIKKFIGKILADNI